MARDALRRPSMSQCVKTTQNSSLDIIQLKQSSLCNRHYMHTIDIAGLQVRQQSELYLISLNTVNV